MRWLKRDIWKAGIAFVGILLLLLLMIWVPVSAAGVYEGASGLTTPVTGTVQATPPQDATVTALNKEKLAQEVQQLKDQNAPDFFGWLRTNAAVLLSTLVVVIGGLIGFFRWLREQRDERKKRDEEQKRWLEDRKAERERQAEERLKEHFDSLSFIVTGLGNEKEDARTGAAVLLRIFLEQRYKQFYKQVFDLAVANLRFLRTSNPPEDPDSVLDIAKRMIGRKKSAAPLPLTPLSRALITVFQESFPLAREELKNREGEQFKPESLNAGGIKLDKAFLWKADLNEIWMPQAYLRGTDLSVAHLRKAALWKGFFQGVNLWSADLEEADLGETDLTKADLTKAKLKGAKLWSPLQEAKLLMADLREAELYRDRYGTAANLSGANLSGANLSGAKLSYTKLVGARLCLARFSKTNPSLVESTEPDLREADLCTVEFDEVFTEVKLRGAKLKGVDISEAELQETTFIRANLQGADLEEADLGEATLIGTDLRGANLSGAKLQNAVFIKVDLQGADLTGAHIEEARSLEGTDLHRVKKGLDEKLLKVYEDKGALIGGDTTTSLP